MMELRRKALLLLETCDVIEMFAVKIGDPLPMTLHRYKSLRHQIHRFLKQEGYARQAITHQSSTPQKDLDLVCGFFEY